MCEEIRKTEPRRLGRGYFFVVDALSIQSGVYENGFMSIMSQLIQNACSSFCAAMSTTGSTPLKGAFACDMNISVAATPSVALGKKKKSPSLAFARDGLDLYFDAYAAIILADSGVPDGLI